MRKKQAAAGSGWAGRELEVRGHRGGLCCMQGSVAVAVGWLFRCGVERCSGPPPCCQGAEVASIHPLRLRRAGLVALGRSGGHLQALALEGLPNVAAGRQGNGWVGGWVGGEYRAGSQDCCSHHGGGPCVSCAQHQRAGPSCTARDAAQPWRAFPAHALTGQHGGDMERGMKKCIGCTPARRHQPLGRPSECCTHRASSPCASPCPPPA